MAARKAAGGRIGRPRRCPDEVLNRVVALHAAGARHADICAQMNADQRSTPGGGKRWWPPHVTRLLKTQDAVKLLNEIRSRDS